MQKVAAVIILFYYSVSSQQIYDFASNTVLDNYYRGILFAGDSTQTVSRKIYFPGLIKDTSSSIAAGYLSASQGLKSFLNTNMAIPQSGLNWSDLYAWSEVNSGIGKIGGWIGNLSGNDQSVESSNTSIQDYATGRCAVWFTPKNDRALRGISLVVDGAYGSSRSDYSSYSYSSTYYYNNFSYYKSSSTLKNKYVSIYANSLIKASTKYDLLIGLYGVYNRGERSNYSSNYSNTYYYGVTQSESSATSDDKSVGGAFTAGIINQNGQQLNITVNGVTRNVNTNYTNASSNPYPYTGAIGVGVEGSQGKLLHYLKHSLFLGINIGASESVPFIAQSNIAFSDLTHFERSNQREFNGFLKFPCIVDINLFKSDVYSILRFTPEIDGSISKLTQNDQMTKSRSVNLFAEELALGLRGKIGSQLEFSIIPSITSNVFMTGLEIKYLLKNK